MEYIHKKIIPYKWSCCWGNSIRSVDFCSSNGNLYQIKKEAILKTVPVVLFVAELILRNGIVLMLKPEKHTGMI